jgi:hypothetical protein
MVVIANADVQRRWTMRFHCSKPSKTIALGKISNLSETRTHHSINSNMNRNIPQSSKNISEHHHKEPKKRERKKPKGEKSINDKKKRTKTLGNTANRYTISTVWLT